MPGSASSFARARQLTPQAPKRAELHLSYNITGPSSRLRTILGALTLAILIAAMLIAAGSAAARGGGIGTDPGARNSDATAAGYARPANCVTVITARSWLPAPIWAVSLKASTLNR